MDRAESGQNLGVRFGVLLRYFAKKGSKYVLIPTLYILHVSFIGCATNFGKKTTMFAYKVKHRKGQPKIATFRETVFYDPIHPIMRHLIEKVYCKAIRESAILVYGTEHRKERQILAIHRCTSHTRLPIILQHIPVLSFQALLRMATSKISVATDVGALLLNMAVSHSAVRHEVEAFSSE